MKRFCLTMVAALMMSASVAAQENGNGEKREARKFDKTEMIKHRTDRMVERYGLDKKQAEKLLQLNTEYADKMGPVGGSRGRFGRGPRPGGPQENAAPAPSEKPNDGQADRKRPSKEEFEAKMKEVKANREAYEKELKKIMTSEQYKKYQEEAQQNKGPRSRGPRPE